MKRVYLVLFLFILLTGSVHSFAQENIRTNPGETRTFLANLLLEKTSVGYSATLKDARIIEGDQKNRKSAMPAWSEGDLIVRLPGSDTRISDTFYLGKPFQTRYEFPGDNGGIGSMTRNSDRASLLLRIPFQESSPTMVLELYGAGSRFKPIAELKATTGQQDKKMN